jgi:hypothetical protein
MAFKDEIWKLRFPLTFLADSILPFDDRANLEKAISG